MAPWEIWTFDFPVEGTHPCVVFSNAARLASPDVERVNVLLCRTLRGPLGRPLKANEVLLNGAMGWTGKHCAAWMRCTSSGRSNCDRSVVW